ncbi:MAG: hypothetical protein K6C36_04035 [Clostridia bacterium]|nr:hypothetical protein [Clostridia bacterium]
MKKKQILPVACVLLAAITVASGFYGCGRKEEATLPYSYKYQETTAPTETEPTTLFPLMTTTAADESSYLPTAPTMTNDSGELIETSIAYFTGAQETPTLVPDDGAETTAAVQTTAGSVIDPLPPTSISPTTETPATTAGSRGDTDVHLALTLPEVNGTMVVTDSASNAYIMTVSSERGIPASQLVAVYSVPDTGQNYVLEFREPSPGQTQTRTADNLRRVYLINESGNIAYIAASDESECENITAVENWFCMDVIIKKMILPEIADRF